MLLSPAHLPRIAAIVGLFTRFGLRDVARQQGLIALVGDDETELPPEELAERHEQAIGFRKRLVELGPAYVKLGQVLSTRPDLLPEPYIEELKRLQDDVGPISLEEVEQTIQEELGGRLSKLFATFDPEPLGTASLGQVHAATLREGREVIVKVQRPGIRASRAPTPVCAAMNSARSWKNSRSLASEARIPGRCTFTITSRPWRSVAACT